MIFPERCKEVGYASTKPCGDRVYFLSKYLVRETEDGPELLEVHLDREGPGLMRKVRSRILLAGAEEVYQYPERVQIHDRGNLIRLACESGKRCTIFYGHDEHMTFVLDPDPATLLQIHVYDISPPLPVLSATIQGLERTGLFGELDVGFVYHVTDISAIQSDVYPCRAAGFPRTLDADQVHPGDRIAGCRTGRDMVREVYAISPEFIETCPLSKVDAEPFVSRCCRAERAGTGMHSGYFGTVVHWGATPAEIFDAVRELTGEWRRRGANRNR